MDEIKATSLTAATQSPDLVFPVDLSALPSGIQSMPGLVSAFVSDYATSHLEAGGVSALGEFTAVRTDGGTAKAYNYLFGVSSDNKTYFAGPFKGFPAHHFDPSRPVPVASLFIGQRKRGGG